MTRPEEDAAKLRRRKNPPSDVCVAKLNLAMAARGANQATLGAQAEIPQSAISEILGQQRSLYAAHAAAMARALRVSLDWLLDDDQPPAWPPPEGPTIRPDHVLARVADALDLSRAEAAAILSPSSGTSPLGDKAGPVVAEGGPTGPPRPKGGRPRKSR